MASAAMWAGIGLLVLSCCGIGLLGVVPVVLGARARGRIGRSAGQLTGDGMALTGIALGALAVLVSLVVIGLLLALVLTGQAAFEGSGTTQA